MKKEQKDLITLAFIATLEDDSKSSCVMKGELRNEKQNINLK